MKLWSNNIGAVDLITAKLDKILIEASSSGRLTPESGRISSAKFSR